MKRIIFVGLHNKPDRMPFDILTRSGQVVNRIIKKLPKGREIVKTNLFDIDQMPLANEIDKLVSEWFWTNLPVDDDIIVLFGQTVQENFPCDKMESKIIRVAHPGYYFRRSKKELDNYIEKVIKEISKRLTL